MRTVRGQIYLPPLKVSEPATLFVRVEDVSRLDSKARRMGQAVIENVTNTDFERGSIPFEVVVQDSDENGTYSVRVLLDLDRDGVAGPGDYVTVQHYPVLERDTSSDLRVTLRRVG
jgi:hypothetical protein